MMTVIIMKMTMIISDGSTLTNAKSSNSVLTSDALHLQWWSWWWWQQSSWWWQCSWKWQFQVGPPLPMPKAVTVCSRVMHYTYMNPVVSSYAFGWFFGSLLPVSFHHHHYHHITITFTTIVITTNIKYKCHSSLWHQKNYKIWSFIADLKWQFVSSKSYSHCK